MIIKPLQGSGGKNVFKIEGPDDSNINQIFEAVSEEGYMIAQGYMPKAKDGDVRVYERHTAGAGWKIRAVLHRSTATQSAPYPRRNSGGTFKAWVAKSGHPVENPDANLGFCFLIFEGTRL